MEDILRGPPHGGVAEIDRQRRIHLNIEISARSLFFVCGEDGYDPMANGHRRRENDKSCHIEGT